MKPRLVVQQKITAFVNKYKVFSVDEEGNANQLVALAQQKRLAFKEKVNFYTDESKQTVAFTFRAEKVLDVHGRYFVEDPSGNLIGMFRKEFGKSLLVSTWSILDAGGNPVYTVKENNVAVAVLRRYVGWIPFVGDLTDLVMNFVKYHFAYTPVGSEQEVGMYQKTTLFRDHYRLSLNDDVYQKVDWRVLAAMSVGLDALQSR